MIILYCPECGEVSVITPGRSSGCLCEKSSAFCHPDGVIRLYSRAVVIHIYQDRFNQALSDVTEKEYESAGFGGEILGDNNKIIKILRMPKKQGVVGMKFSVRRTASWGPHCPEVEGNFRIFREGDKWVVDLIDLAHLIEFIRAQRVPAVITSYRNEPDLPEIEIYDDYRE